MLTEKTLLVEEGGTNTEVFIVLRGTVKYFRRLPGHRKIKVKDRMPIVGINEEFVASNEKTKKPNPGAADFFRTKTVIPDDPDDATGSMKYKVLKKIREE